MKEEVYEKKCNDYIDNVSSSVQPSVYDDMHESLRIRVLQNRPWKYNQIIGFIVISFYQNSICFDKYITFDKRIHAIGNTKHFIHNVGLNGFHFYVFDEMTDEEIKKEINKLLKDIERSLHTSNRLYFLDKEVFSRQLNCVDVKKLIENI